MRFDFFKELFNIRDDYIMSMVKLIVELVLVFFKFVLEFGEYLFIIFL